jgi:hypothetical protein
MRGLPEAKRNNIGRHLLGEYCIFGPQKMRFTKRIREYKKSKRKNDRVGRT